ncbi:HlyD family type I secretion periplasmic adaptor subunit [Rhizobium sp. 2YAF20]|uniref:HlyD family type I secretion periplasmic adaptor subunit n=1 Tax=Rhizobium sp. 2YAF20 TaxID=3233027 RepID=UPI003F9A8781
MKPSAPDQVAIARSAFPAVVSGRDREFLPAALEILETPPPPLPTALIWTICLFALASLVWSVVGRLDVLAVAPGKIETTEYSKVIEPLEPGKIAAIHVRAGEWVTEGELLFELDPAEATADAQAAEDDLNASLAEIDRRRYAINIVRTAESEESQGSRVIHANEPNSADASQTLDSPVEKLSQRRDLKIDWDVSLPESFRLRENAVLATDLAQLSDSLKAFDEQMAQQSATRKRLNASIAMQYTLVSTLDQRVASRQHAIDLSVGTKNNLYDAQEELEKTQVQLAFDQGQLTETDAALMGVQSEKVKTISQFIADNQNRITEASRRFDQARHAFQKVTARLARTKLHSPIDGVVQQTAVTTVGQVVTTAQELAIITPSGSKLQMEALVANVDIGFVKIGQDAVVKVDAFPFTRFGILHGKIVKIASNAIAEQDAKRALADVTVAASNTSPASMPGEPASFVFPITIALDEGAIRTNGAVFPLTSGMTGTVEIKTDTRRVIDYIFSPLAKIVSEAGGER